MKKYLAAFFVSITLFGFQTAAAPVWKVSKGKNYLYLGGTIHMLSKGDYPLPAAFENAYKDSGTVVFEVDLAQINSPQFIQKLLFENMYKGDDDLTQHLKPATLKKLEQFLKGRGMTLEPFKKMKAGFLTLMLTTVEMQRMGMDEAGVDQYYNDKAVKDGKSIAQLESAEEQLRFITNMGFGNEDELILHSLEEMDSIDEVMAAMKSSWRKGALSDLEKMEMAEMKSEFPDLYRELLVDRNNNWMPQIKAMFDTVEIEFVLVGALHLAGEDGLLHKLEKAGYKIQKME